MEQHNIDSHFKEGLSNISRQPSADAWARLQNQMAETSETPVIVPEKEEEKRKPVFWLSIAAAIITLLVSIAVFRFGQNSETTSPELAAKLPAQTSMPEVKTATQQPENNQIASVSTPKSKEGINGPKQIKKWSNTVISTNKNQEISSENHQLAQVKTSKVEPITNPETNLKPQEKTEVSEIMLAVQTPAPKAEKTTNPEADLMNQHIEVIVKRDASSNQVAMNEPEKSEEPQGSLKFKNIIKQAVNLKQGEGVNLAELGLNQNSKLAMDARSLRHKVSRVFEN